MMMVPVMAMPVMMVPVVMVVPMVAIVHLDRLDVVDFALRHDRLLDVCRRHGRRLARERRQRSRLSACGKHDRARDQSGTEFQQIPKFHDVMHLSQAEKKACSLAIAR